ncbi:hypothetical protein DFJ74DRAFT_709020 [Hyaloraphidium curvatum]|nr:hypothetical protein DFJ74DRAFT_709020 [Hyaloraphidium curvatum]
MLSRLQAPSLLLRPARALSTSSGPLVARCRTTQCPHCGKIGWAGCGMHVDYIAQQVDKKDRCSHVPWPDATAAQIREAQEAAEKAKPKDGKM